MSKFNEILNSSNASDALLGEQIDAVDKSIKIVDVSFSNLSYAAGTVGSRGLQVHADLSSVLGVGYSIIGMSVIDIGDGSSAKTTIVPLITNKSIPFMVYVNFYRATNEASSFSNVTVRVVAKITNNIVEIKAS